MRYFYIFLMTSVIVLQAQSGEFITNHVQSDGFGSQLQTIISACVYAELNNKEYVYTPFQSMEHNYDNDDDFIAKKEWLINLKGNIRTVEELDFDVRNKIKLDIPYKVFFDANVILCAKSNALEELRNIFRANKKQINYFQEGTFNIAIHIRRPNPHDNRILGAETSNVFYENLLNKLRVIHAKKRPLFHIYSQGKEANFVRFCYQDVILHLDESLEDTFTSMVFADVLVTGTSSLSYAAGLLSNSVVYYVPFWHKPLPNWISTKSLGINYCSV